MRRIVLGGVRFGATFAALAAQGAVAADGLLLFSPVLNGRSWLKRLRFSARVAKYGGALGGDQQAVDTDGLWLSPATANSLSRIDLAAAVPPKAPVLLAAQNKLVAEYAAGLAQAGAPVTASDFPGFNELFLEPAVNLPPDALFRRACAWLGETFTPRAAAAPMPGAVGATVLRPPGAVEQCVAFGAGLRGVYCQPDRADLDAPTVLFVNAAGDPRAGSGGFACRTARRLAAQGCASLRFDLAGLGDSDMPGAAVRCHVFETPREADIDAAVAFLVQQGRRDIVIVGLCSGAYHALRAAWRNTDIGGVFAISPSKILWRPGDDASFVRDEFLLSLDIYAKALFDPLAWKRALERRINLLDFLLALCNRLKNRVMGWFRRRTRLSPLGQMQRFIGRGGRAAFVMGVDDTSLEEMATHFGISGGEVRGLDNTRIEIIPDLDHGLALRSSRESVMDLLTAWLKEPEPS